MSANAIAVTDPRSTSTNTVAVTDPGSTSTVTVTGPEGMSVAATNPNNAVAGPAAPRATLGGGGGKWYAVMVGREIRVLQGWSVLACVDLLYPVQLFFRARVAPLVVECPGNVSKKCKSEAAARAMFEQAKALGTTHVVL